MVVMGVNVWATRITPVDEIPLDALKSAPVSEVALLCQLLLMVMKMVVLKMCLT